MKIETINANSFEDFDSHEKVARCIDEATGLHGLIAIHNRNLGPALGGCRMCVYENEDAAIKDVLRLSKGMTYKSALAGLPLGGGKSIIIGDSKSAKNAALMASMAKFIDSFDGAYIGAEDSGTTVADLKLMQDYTDYVAGVADRTLKDGTVVDGDPSPATALGVFTGIKASLQRRFNTSALDQVKVAVQGVGSVGGNLVKLLVEAGAMVFVTDAYERAIRNLTNDLSDHANRIKVVATDEIYGLNVEVFAPCALGSSLNTKSLVELKAPIVAGAANNQLADEGAGEYLFHKGILYAPDFVINSGGIIDIFYQREGYDQDRVNAHILTIEKTVAEIFEFSEQNRLPTHLTAEKLGEARFMGLDIDHVA